MFRIVFVLCNKTSRCCSQGHGECAGYPAGLPRQLCAEDAETQAGEMGTSPRHRGTQDCRPGLPGQAGHNRPHHPSGDPLLIVMVHTWLKFESTKFNAE